MTQSIIRWLAIFTFILTSLLFSHLVSAESSVWKIAKGDDFIFIGGTVHILPPSQFPLPKEFIIAYENSDTVVLETQVPSPTDMEFQNKLQQKATYQSPNSLKQVIKRSTYRKLAEYLVAYGINLDDFANYKPGFIVTMMAIMEAQRANIAGDGVDVYLYNRAKTDNKKADYLESMEFQLELIANMGRGNEDTLVLSTITQLAEFKEMFWQLIPAWRAGDEQLLNDFVTKPMAEDDPALFNTMIVDRNKNWLPKIEKMFVDSDREFVLVGVAHLVGKDSVLELLTKKGYQISKL